MKTSLQSEATGHGDPSYNLGEVKIKVFESLFHSHIQGNVPGENTLASFLVYLFSVENKFLLSALLPAISFA